MNNKSKGIAYVLWFFLGLLGGHRFYTGRYVTGIIQLFTGGGFFVWWAIDALLIPGMVNDCNRNNVQQQPTIVINNSGSGDVTNK